MLFIWYLWSVKYYWVPISLIVVKVWAVLCPPVKDFILLCETLPLVFLLSGPWLTGMLSCCYSFWGMLLLLCPDLSFNLSVDFGSFWLASLFLQVSSLGNLRSKRKPMRLFSMQICLAFCLCRQCSQIYNLSKTVRFKVFEYISGRLKIGTEWYILLYFSVRVVKLNPIQVC